MLVRRQTAATFLALTLCACQGPELCTGERAHSIIDGTSATDEQHQATAAVLASAEIPGDILAELACSGVLIAPDVVLTAAHCLAFYQFEDEPELPAVRFLVSFDNDVSAFDAGDAPLPTDAVPVREVAIHPGFSLERRAPIEALGQMDDIALLFLSEAVTTRKPVPLFRAGAELTPESEVQIAGYGLVDLDDQEKGLGIKRFGTSFLFEVGAHELRVGRATSADDTFPAGTVDKCYGDSGGPTFLERAGERWLIGITSRGYKVRAECGVAGVDTRVDAYAEWIEQTAQQACADGRREPSSCTGSPGEHRDEAGCR